MSTSTPTLIQEPEQHEYSSSQRTLVDNESTEQGDSLSQLDLSEDDGERPPLFHMSAQPRWNCRSNNSTTHLNLKQINIQRMVVGNCHVGFQHIAIHGYCSSSQEIW